MIAIATVLIVLLVFWNMFRSTPRTASGPEPTLTVHEPESQPVVPAAAAQPPPATGMASQGTIVPAAPETREPTYIELLARSETRRRIRLSGSGTYLGEMLAESSDSMLRRWENRQSSPIRVWFTSTNAANFRPAFVDAVQTAFTQWTSVGVPVRFMFNADSTSAEVTVRWRIQFEIERTGQTDVTWDQNGLIQSAVVTIATFDPKGRPMEPDDIRVVATHEVGHLLGLDHSQDSTDIMFPTAKVRDISPRDARTVMLLYQLSPGSLR